MSTLYPLIAMLKRYNLKEDIDDYIDPKNDRVPHPGGEIYGSDVGDGRHLAMFDIDIDALLIPSRTPGHHHLYFDKTLTFKQYAKVMRAMADAGLIDKQWYKMAKLRKETFLRVPRPRA